MQAAGFLLAGGKSSRMGRNKALLELDGEPLVARGLRLLAEVCDEVAIVGGAGELGRFGRLIPDGWPECGPLGGIVSALEQTSFEWNMFLAVDMPFVPETALRSLMDGGALVTVPRVEGRVHPLCGVYSRNALSALRVQLVAGRFAVQEAIAATGRVSYVEWDDARWASNLNTPEEFSAAMQKV